MVAPSQVQADSRNAAEAVDPSTLTETTMKKTFQQLLAAGAAFALLGTAACTTLEASTGYGDGAGTSQSDITQQMQADSLGGA
jgi:hypothetical protein